MPQVEIDISLAEPRKKNRGPESNRLQEEQEEFPQQLKDASTTHLCKREENKQLCDNHQGISILVITGKILARVLLNCLSQHLEVGHLLESQCGFRKGRRTADMVFTVRQLNEKYQEQNRDLYITFVDLTKAFETGSREEFWKTIRKFCLHCLSQCCVNSTMACPPETDSSEAFPVTNGVKQGCILTPTFFSMMLTAMLTDSFFQ